MANRIVENDPQVTVTLKAGDTWKVNIAGQTIWAFIAFNKKHGSWNLIDVSTGEFLFDKDIRSVAKIIEELENGNAVQVYSLTISSDKQDLTVQ